MKYIFLSMVLLFFSRHQIMMDSQYHMSQMIGFAALYTLMAIVLLFASLIFLSKLPDAINSILEYAIYFAVGFICMSVSCRYEFGNILSDPVQVLLFLLILLTFTLFSKKVVKNEFSELPQFRESELRKAFLTYPPKLISDFLFFYFYLIVIMLVPFIMNAYWSSIL